MTEYLFARLDEVEDLDDDLQAQIDAINVILSGLSDITGLTPDDGAFIVGNGTVFVTETGNTARTSLGLGTGDSPQFTAITVDDLAYDASSWNGSLAVPTRNAIRDYLETLTGTTLPATYQPLDADLTAIAALATAAYGRSLLTQATALAARATLEAQKAIGENVQEHGAVGDGVTDDTTAIDAAHAAAAAGDKVVIYPPGTYLYVPSGSGWSPGTSVKVYGYGATVKKGGNGTLGTLASAVEITGLSFAGDGGTYTGAGLVITAGNDQKLYDVDITDFEGRCLSINKDVGLRFAWIGGTTYRHTNITDIPILLAADGTPEESNGDRVFVGLFTAGRWLIDTDFSQTTIVSNCDFVNMNVGANSSKTMVTDCRIATLGDDFVIRGTQGNFDGNIIAGGVEIAAGATFNRYGSNVIPDGEFVTDNSGNSTNQQAVMVVGGFGSSGQLLTSNGAGNYPSFQTISYQPLDSDLTAIAALSTTSYGRSLLTLANATALAAEIDSFFLTQVEGDARYVKIDHQITTTTIDSDHSFYFSTYECLSSIFFELTQSEDQSDFDGGGFRDVLAIFHYDDDTTDYEALADQKVSYGIRSYVTPSTAGGLSNAQYKDFTAGTFECIGRIEWADRGVSGITASSIQYGQGIASNEFAASNPAAASTQSLSMAAVQAIVSGKKGASDASHRVRGFLTTNLGKQATAAFQALSAGTDGDNGQFEYLLSGDGATVATAAIIMPASGTGQVGTKILYDTGDYTDFDRSGNIFSWVIGGSGELFLSIGTLAPVVDGGLQLGTASTQWADLFLELGGTIQFNNGDVAWTHSANLMVFDGGGYVHNEAGGDFDFRVEADTDTHAIFVDASVDRVGIGHAVPLSKLHVISTEGDAPSNGRTHQFILESAETASVGLGPTLFFRGQTGNSTAEYAFGAIQGAKASATASNYEGYLAFFYQNSGGSSDLTEQMRMGAGGLSIVNGLRVGFTGTPTDDAVTIGDANFQILFSATVPLISFDSNDYIVFNRSSNFYDMVIGGNTKMRVDSTATARDTALMIYDVDNATLERVTVGIADSGGAGFKLLRVPN